MTTLFFKCPFYDGSRRSSRKQQQKDRLRDKMFIFNCFHNGFSHVVGCFNQISEREKVKSASLKPPSRA